MKGLVKLTQISDEVCPHCGAQCTSSEQGSLHTNGLWNEYRYFSCGLILHFSPNFQSILCKANCVNSPTYKLKIRKRSAAVQKLTKYIARLDVDREFMAKLHTVVQTVPKE